MRILFAGATGYLGVPLLAALIDRGHDVTCLLRGDAARKAARLERLVGKTVRFVSGTVTDELWGLADITSSELESFDVVLNAAGETRWSAPAQHLWEANVAGATHGLELAVELQAGYVYISSLHAAYRTDGSVHEELCDPSADLTHYERSKCVAELAVMGRASRGRTRSTCIRVGALSGDFEPTATRRVRPAPLARLLEFHRWSAVPYVAGARVDVLPRDIVAASIARLFEDEEALFATAVRHVSSGERAPLVDSLLREMWNLREDQFRRPKVAIRTPSRLGVAISRFGDRIAETERDSVVIGVRYLCSRAIFTSSLPPVEISTASLARTVLGMEPPALPQEPNPFYATWSSLVTS